MASIAKKRFTPPEYLAFERKALTKHEYFDGEICAMSGATKAHVRISGNMYRQIPSLAEIVFVAQDSPSVEQFIRHPGDSWVFKITTRLDATIFLESIECQLSLAQIYQNVEFTPEAISLTTLTDED